MKKYTIFFCLLSVLMLGSCKKYLTEESEDNFTASTLFETPEGLEKMVIALYPYERSLVSKGTANGILSAFIWNERTTDLSNFTTGDDANLSRYSSPGPSSNIRDLYTVLTGHTATTSSAAAMRSFIMERSSAIRLNKQWQKLLSGEPIVIMACGPGFRGFSCQQNL
jgi:hypothetical protein